MIHTRFGSETTVGDNVVKKEKSAHATSSSAGKRPLSGTLFKPISAGMNSFSLNACVGHNTGSIDNSESYSDGFQIGTEVLLRAAGVSAPEGAREGWGAYPPVDALVYPICYGARHHAELVLKRITQRMWELYNLRWPDNPKKFAQPKQIDLSHNTYDVWEQLHGYCVATDARLAEVSAELEPYIRDIDYVDDTGQAFRYPTSAQTSAMHLTNLSIINLAHFSEGFARMTALLESLESRIINVREEVSTGTFTSKLNREQLVAIARRLSDAGCNTDEQVKVKGEVMAEYGISSSQFDKARAVIAKTHSLAHHMGVTLPLKGVTKEMFQRLKRVHAKEIEASGALTNVEQAALYALQDIGLGKIYPEMFERAVEEAASDDESSSHYERVHDAAHLARKVVGRPDIVESALIKMGQDQLAADFAEVYGQEIKALRDTLAHSGQLSVAEMLVRARAGEDPRVQEEDAD